MDRTPDEAVGASGRRADPVAEGGDLALAYAFLQKVVGVIAVALPFVVALGDWVLDGHGARGSISAYYYGRTGNYFVGSLCALGVFFFSYEYRPRPERRLDKRLSDAAFVLAVGVALLPTSSEGRQATGGSKWVGFAHLGCAGALFVLLAFFSLYQFTRTGDEMRLGMSWRDKLLRLFRTQPEVLGRMTDRKRTRNLIYRVSGWVIVACIAGILLSNSQHWNVVFWLESTAVVAFGCSWLVKGDMFPWLNDAPRVEPAR